MSESSQARAVQHAGKVSYQYALQWVRFFQDSIRSNKKPGQTWSEAAVERWNSYSAHMAEEHKKGNLQSWPPK